MKIVAGLGSVWDYETLVKAGADEVFCGFVPPEWNTEYNNNLPINRREVMFYHVQIGTYEEMKILKRMIDEYKVPVTITMNALYYTEEQFSMISEIISNLIDIGFIEYIIADIGLIMYLTKNSETIFKNKDGICNIHVSGELGEWNQYTLKMLCDDNGIFENQRVRINRIIFHRKNSILDMSECIKLYKQKQLQYEAFAINEMCHFTGGFCNSLHCDEMCHICQLPYKVGPIGAYDSKVETDILDVDNHIIGASGCGLCALWKLKSAGITHLKVVGRGKSADLMAKDIEALKKSLYILEEEKNEVEFIQRVKNEILGNNCSEVCYYWEQ